RLFEEITKTSEYYPTRMERQILRNRSDSIADLFGPKAVIIEPGSGSGEKIRYFLDELDRPALYVPIDISRAALEEMVARLRTEYPSLPICPICADYSDPSALGIPRFPSGRARKSL